MGSPSKEENVLRLILEESPLKEWHFAEVVRNAHVTRAVANKWLQRLVAEGILHHVKRPGRFPIYTVGRNNHTYCERKRLYALEQLHESGLLAKLASLEGPQTIILFGSMSKGDWYKESDIDLFILGELPDFDENSYEKRLHRRIEVHHFADKKELKRVKSGLLKNLLDGYVLKGSIQDIAKVAV